MGPWVLVRKAQRRHPSFMTLSLMMPSWMNRRGVRLSAAAEVAVDGEAFHSKHELCRRIRRLASKDRKRRSAGLLERMLRDTELAVMVRLEAARALAQWDPALVLPAVERLMESPEEIPSLKKSLSILVARWRVPA